MKTLILLTFMLIASAFAGKMQELVCGDKSLLYCINHFDRQCKAKNYGVCYVVASLYEEQEQYGEAKKYYEMVCDRANGRDSYELERIDGGVSEFHNIIKSMQASCAYLGNFYYTGLGVRQNYKKAFHYHKKACDLGYDGGCADVGIAYYEGKGVKKDLKTAIKFFAKSCELESGFGCVALGALYYDGDSVKQNLPKAKELYGKACDFGEQRGCDKYKELKEKGY